ncbi:hypothetical protein WT29_05465 [Burkholderia stagnalis]|nr:hypothetical protein WT29_05465 [Burkholderia stagnalis]
MEIAAAIFVPVWPTEVGMAWIRIYRWSLFVWGCLLLGLAGGLCVLRFCCLLLCLFFLGFFLALLDGKVKEVPSLVKYWREAIIQKWMALGLLLNKRLNSSNFYVKLARHMLILGIRKEFRARVIQS